MLLVFVLAHNFIGACVLELKSVVEIVVFYFDDLLWWASDNCPFFRYLLLTFFLDMEDILWKLLFLKSYLLCSHLLEELFGSCWGMVGRRFLIARTWFWFKDISFGVLFVDLPILWNIWTEMLWRSLLLHQWSIRTFLRRFKLWQGLVFKIFLILVLLYNSKMVMINGVLYQQRVLVYWMVDSKHFKDYL